MARARKRHVQTELAFPRRGGKRANAGRPKSGFRASEPHKQRVRFDRLTAVHVTLRLVDRYGPLRKRDTYYAVRKATKAVLDRSDFRIVHISIENDHIHLIVEAERHEALWRGVQAFEISAAQRLNRALEKRTGKKRRGKVFADRYHERLIKSPTQARHAINYVLRGSTTIRIANVARRFPLFTCRAETRLLRDATDAVVSRRSHSTVRLTR